MKRAQSHESVQASNIAAEAVLTSHQVSELIQVNPSSVNNWVKDGRLRAFRTPGGHRRIRARDLADFLAAHQMPIPRELRFATKRRVLMVDDEAKQLSAFARMLEPYADRLEVHTADNGIDALMMVPTLEPHLIVMDIFMPNIDGLEVCRRLRANPKTTGIDVIVVSGSLNEATRAEALAAGAQRCIEKPIDPQAIFGALGLELEAPRGPS